MSTKQREPVHCFPTLHKCKQHSRGSLEDLFIFQLTKVKAIAGGASSELHCIGIYSVPRYS